MGVTFERTTLDNGLTIIAEVDADAHTSAGGFFVKAGSRDESPEVMGVSHFLEHMMFKGTDRRSADDINREFDELGASYNAYTTSEMTCFYAHVLPEMMGSAIDLLGDMMRPALREEDFEQERGVILEEIAMYMDNPFWVLYDELTTRRYPGHPLGHLVLGTPETIKAMSASQMREYFEHWYAADNTVVALSGRLDFGSCVEQIRGLCQAWNTSGARRDNTEPSGRGEAFTLSRESVVRGYYLAMSPAPSVQSEDRYAASLLAKALGDADNSRLYWALLETGLADEAQASYDPHDGGGSFMLYASCEPGKMDDVRAVIDEEIGSLLENIGESDLERLRNKAATAVTVAGERPAGRMQRLGRLWTYLGEHRTLEEELAILCSVTMDDLRGVYEAYPFAPRTQGVLAPAQVETGSS
ncbi:MAG: M16 family metallopeptidase [Planctomycetota bacterium]|jgi:predicted Zn-dependent peptidase